MGIKKIAIAGACISFALSTSILNTSTINAATLSTPSILDNVYYDIVPGKNVLVYVLDNPNQKITSQDVKDAFSKINENVTNNLPPVIATGTEIVTDAHTYTVMVYGDVNGDGLVDVFDSQAIALHLENVDKRLTGVYLRAGNVSNSTDEVNLLDAQRIAEFSIGAEKSLVKETLKPSIDNIAPVISLVGEKEIFVKVGDTYTDGGANSTDNKDASKTVNGVIYKNGIQVSNIDTTTVGDYVIKYNDTDTAGNKSIEVTRNVYVRKAMTVINYTDTDMSLKQIYANQDVLIKTIKVDSNEMPYNLEELKAYVTKSGAELSQDKAKIKFVKNGDNIDVYANLKEIANISVIPYFGETYDIKDSIQGIVINLRSVNNVQSLSISNVSGKPSYRMLNFYNGSNVVDVMLSDIHVNPVDPSTLNNGQVVIKTTGNIAIDLKSSSMITTTNPDSIGKYIDIKSTDASIAIGTIEIYAVGNEAGKKIINIEKETVKSIKLPYNRVVNMSINDLEDITADKVQNREIIKKSVNGNLYLLIPVELYSDLAMANKYRLTVKDVYIEPGSFASNLVADKLTFTSNNDLLTVSTKLFAVNGNDILDVSKNSSSYFDYVGFSFNEEVSGLEITVSFGNVADSSTPGYVASKKIFIN